MYGQLWKFLYMKNGNYYYDIVEANHVTEAIEQIEATHENVDIKMIWKDNILYWEKIELE